MLQIMDDKPHRALDPASGSATGDARVAVKVAAALRNATATLAGTKRGRGGDDDGMEEDEDGNPLSSDFKRPILVEKAPKQRRPITVELAGDREQSRGRGRGRHEDLDDPSHESSLRLTAERF